jgi:hypothetical protein
MLDAAHLIAVAANEHAVSSRRFPVLRLRRQRPVPCGWGCLRGGRLHGQVGWFGTSAPGTAPLDTSNSDVNYVTLR